MKRWLHRLPLMLAAFALDGATGAAQPAGTNAVPIIACDAPVFSFGTLPDVAPVTNAFTIWNRGGAPLIISDVRACCGGRAQVAGEIVAPGTNTTILAELSVRGRSGAQNKSFYVASNDPKQPYYRLAFSGQIVPQVSLSPAAVVLRDLDVQCATSVTVSVISRIMGGTPTNALPGAQWLTASVGARHGETTPITLSTVPPLPKGTAMTTVRLLFPDPQLKPIEMPVTLSVPQEITVMPAEIVLVWDPERKQRVSRYLQLRSARSEPFRVKRVIAPVADWTSEATPTGTGTWRIRLSEIRADRAAEQELLQIETDLPSCPELRIPIKVVDP